MHKIGSPVHMNYTQNYSPVKKSDTGFDNTLEEQGKDESKESSSNKNLKMT